MHKLTRRSFGRRISRIKVKATNESKLLGLKVRELGRIAEEGEIFEVTEERFDILNGNNEYKKKFVTRVRKKKKES